MYFFIFMFQISILSLITLALYIKKSIFILSFLCGGLISLCSSLPVYFFFYNTASTNANKILKFFYLSIIIKISILLFLFLYFFKAGINSPIHFFISLIIIQISFWLGCIFYFFIWSHIFYERQ